MMNNQIQVLNELRRSSAEMLKAELMERYGLREDQVAIEVTVCTTDLGLGKQILADFDKFPASGKDYLGSNSNSDYVFGSEVQFLSVHRKDGRYGTYVNESE